MNDLCDWSGAVAWRLKRTRLGATLLGLGLLAVRGVASDPQPVCPGVVAANGVLAWCLPESHDPGWIIQHSEDLTHWESVGDPLWIAVRSGPAIDLPVLQSGAQGYYRAAPAERAARTQLLQDQRSRWTAAKLDRYEFEFHRSCFCPPEFTQWVRIGVADDTIVSVRRVEDGAPLPAEEWGRYPTLNGLFEWLADAFEQEAFRIEVTYDAGLGHPVFGYVDYHELMVDEEQGFGVRFASPTSVLALADPPASWPGEPYQIEAVSRQGDWLQIDVGFTGGCVEPHGWELTVVPAPASVGDVQEVALYLSHDALGDRCEAYLHRRLTFDLGSLRTAWSGRDPASGAGPARLALIVLDPASSPPKPVARVDYDWDPTVPLSRRQIVAGTSQAWQGGVFGSGSGIDYELTLWFPPGWGTAIAIQSLWIGDRAFQPDVAWRTLPGGGGRIATLTAAYRAIPRLDPEHPGEVLGVDESPPRDPNPPAYSGAALLRTKTLGQVQDWPIPTLHALPPLFYP